MGLSWGLAFRLSQNYLDRLGISDQGFMGLFWGIFLSSWIGSKVFFLIYSSGGEFVQHSQSLSFWLGGGFVFYGGFIFGILYLIFYCLILKKFNLKNSYILIAPLSFGHALGRLGCFLAGCCFGVKSDLPWAVHLHDHLRHPVQLYEALILVLLGIVIARNTLNKKWSPQKIFIFYVASYSILRFLLEFLRGDIIRGIHFMGLSTSQIISLIIFILGIIFMMPWKNRHGL